MATFPNSATADGIWSLKKQKRAKQGSDWPALAPVQPSLPSGTVLYINAESATLNDGSSNNYTISNAGGASRSTSVVKVGTGSVDFDGSDNAYIYVSGETFFKNSLSSWQFQCWARNRGGIPGTGDTGQLIDQYQAGAAGRMIFGFQDSGIDLRVNGGTIYLTSGDILSGDTWYHVCLNYDGTTHRLFIDGDLKDSSTTVPSLWTGVDTGFGGGGALGGYDLDGYMDDILVQHNSTVFTSNFTPNTTGYS
jgi:hypothetical protein